MLVLGIETSTSRSSVALVDRQRVVASASLGVDRRHGEFVSPAIEFCLAQAGVGADRLTGVAVGLGPGLFTGLRVGIATAQAIAAARRLPVVGLASLDVLAFQARYTPRLLCSVVDVRRKELCWAFYRAAPGGVQREGELRIGSVATLSAELAAQGEDVLVIGDGALTYRDEIEDVHVDLAGPDLAWPDAAVLAELAVPASNVRTPSRPPICSRSTCGRPTRRSAGRPGAGCAAARRARDRPRRRGAPVARAWRWTRGRRGSGPRRPRRDDRPTRGGRPGRGARGRRGRITSPVDAEDPRCRAVSARSHLPGAWVDGQLVGFAGLADLAGEGHVMALAVAPAMQRRGIGRRLLEALLTEAEHAGLDGVTLEVRASDARTRRLYRRAGFVEQGVRPGYYPDGEDAVIAWRR
jgi:tRNA threonylcarbamoyladenosine biosynthesis protein TsaB